MTPSSDLIRAPERGRMEVPDVLSPVVQVVSSPVPRAKYRAGDLVSLMCRGRKFCNSTSGIKYDQPVILRARTRHTCQLGIHVHVYFPYLQFTL